MRNMLCYLSGSAIAASMALTGAAAFAEGDKGVVEAQANATLERCAAVADTCAEVVQAAAGVLVFPEVVEADLIVGGAGGEGVLLIDGRVEGYYNIGKASVGLQAGIDRKSVVFAFRDDASLAALVDRDEWEVGAGADVTVVTANADVEIDTGDPLVYVFDTEGLSAGIDVNAFRIWEDDDRGGS